MLSLLPVFSGEEIIKVTMDAGGLLYYSIVE
jgi:hypothetical protein